MMINKRLIGTVAESKKIHSGKCNSTVVLPYGEHCPDAQYFPNACRAFQGFGLGAAFHSDGNRCNFGVGSPVFLLHRGRQNGVLLLQSSQKVFA